MTRSMKNKLKIRLKMFHFFSPTSIDQFKFIYDKKMRCFFSNKLIKLLI